ncbi:hypothetical protein HDV00_012395 [Rhizophlyctis rosea]|nr:hypothetical protein HDV00_012395 [Rhizophlyctis rosea]
MSNRAITRIARPARLAVARPQSVIARPRVAQQQRLYSQARAANEGKGTSPIVLALGLAAVLGGGYYFYQNSTGKPLFDSAAESAKHGDLKGAAIKAKDGLKISSETAYPELTSTLRSLFGDEAATSVSKALAATRDIQRAISTDLSSSPTGANLRKKAEELQDDIKAALKEAVDIQKRAIKELGPSAKAHYDAVKKSVEGEGKDLGDRLEAAIGALKREGKQFYNEAVSSHVGEEVRVKLQGLVERVEELRKQTEEAIRREKK